MSEWFEMLVDPDVGEDNAEKLSHRVLSALREHELITETASKECVLGGIGYPPGPRAPDVYCLAEREGAFWTLRTSGVEPCVGRGFNEWALGPVCEGLCCHSCGVTFKPFADIYADDFGDLFARAIGQWMKDATVMNIPCPHCKTQILLTDWPCDPPLGFGNLAFRFWNWPPLDSSSWKIDIPGMLRYVTGHRIVHTCGRI
jgi:hypothetical protein